MRLCLINPSNPFVSLAKEKRWQRYRVWKPLGLLTVAGLTPDSWDVSIIDENLGAPDYASVPRPDLVGLTAATPQAPRAYQVAAQFRAMGVPVVIGGIHGTMCPDEALAHVDTVVTGEAEQVWAQVLDDARHGRLRRTYDGKHAEMDRVPPARHDLLGSDYGFGAIQTTRGCPLNCTFCSVTTFNGGRYRHRPIENVLQEFRSIREKLVLIVDDNLIGTRAEHMERAKDLFRAMIRAKLRKHWIAQATINFADDDELLRLAARAGCRGVFIGFESHSTEGLIEVGKKFNLRGDRDMRASVRRIRRHRIVVAGSFIIGLNTDRPGAGARIVQACRDYDIDILNLLFLTPLPGTKLWEQMASQGLLDADRFPEDWQYYTLNLPVARYRHLSRAQIINEVDSCLHTFYSVPGILRRVGSQLWRGQRLLTSLVTNLSYRRNLSLDRQAYRAYTESRHQS